MLPFSLTNECIGTLRTSGTETNFKLRVKIAGKPQDCRSKLRQTLLELVDEIIDHMLQPTENEWLCTPYISPTLSTATSYNRSRKENETAYKFEPIRVFAKSIAKTPCGRVIIDKEEEVTSNKTLFVPIPRVRLEDFKSWFKEKIIFISLFRSRGSTGVYI
ncbi:hypothetical protein ABG067_007181 [Albugo candida]